MIRPYLILVNGKLWDRKLTYQMATRVCNELRDKGLSASVAYSDKRDFDVITTNKGA